MIRPKALFLFFATLVSCDQESLAVGKFFNPPNAPESPSPFSDNAVWAVGDVQTIKFTTTYSNYTVALWQQNLEGGFALLGPVIFQTETNAFPQFDWAIQVFDLDLSFSSVFFLWLHAGVSADQGKPQPLSVTSAFFNITRAAAAGSASNATATSSAVASTSTPAVMVTATSGPAIGEDGSGQVDGLSTGAKAGIGIGASLAVCGAVTAVYFCLRKKIRASADRANRTKDEVEGTRPIDGAVHEKPVDTGLTELDGQQEYQHHISPIKRTPVELSQD
ncbi:hypothetical protein BKA67DRAFT_385963 [Truncatella angustata]|uniref:Uncharacterized protein n=1 Tax=Truncatella angustata TaxID=152316 RepID=A0A9P8RKB4_9PEZI|nr:uncharacterized protein BKA67DRAFT_385963 [Truncatella angustata]KAH6647401.1 hypothetical protein BKA67DRAFT_385963 [Truncatella angustata]